MVTFMNGATLSELFNNKKYDRTIEPFEREIDGKMVQRKKFIFRKIAPIRTIEEISIKSKKFQSTFIPLFDKK